MVFREAYPVTACILFAGLAGGCSTSHGSSQLDPGGGILGKSSGTIPDNGAIGQSPPPGGYGSPVTPAGFGEPPSAGQPPAQPTPLPSPTPLPTGPPGYPAANAPPGYPATNGPQGYPAANPQGYPPGCAPGYYPQQGTSYPVYGPGVPVYGPPPGDPHMRSTPTLVGGRLELGPWEVPADRVVELTRQIESLAALNQSLQARIRDLEMNGVSREQSLAEAVRDLESSETDLAKMKTVRSSSRAKTWRSCGPASRRWRKRMSKR